MTRIPRGALSALALFAASCVGHPAFAQNLQPSGLPARGAVQGTDVIVDQPAGSSTVQGAQASAIATYVQQNGAPGSSGQVVINLGGAFAGVTVSGDGTLSGSGGLTVTKTNGVSFAISATTDATNATNIASGTLPGGRLSGSYTGITGVGTLAAGSVPSILVTGLPFVSVNSFSGVDPTGVSDSTTGLQTALNSGAYLTCDGVYKVSATLTLAVAGAEGITLDGGAPQAQSTYSSGGRCVFKPTSGVSPVFKIDGSSFSGYIQAAKFRSVSLDLTNDTSGIGFAQYQGFDVSFDNVRVLNGAIGECSWQFDPGAFTTQVANSWGMYACWNGNGTANPTTQIFVNADLVGISGGYGGSVAFFGGAIQPQYVNTMTEVYSAASDNNRPTAIYSASTGAYLTVALTLSNMDSVTFDGTYLGPVSGFPSTYNDGTHGSLSAYPVFEVPTTLTRLSFTPSGFVSMYLYDLGPSTNAWQINVGGGSAGNIVGAATSFKNGAAAVNGSNLTTFSDNGHTQTCQIVGSSGAETCQGLTLKPASDGSVLTIETAAAAGVFVCNTISTAYCDLLNGTGLYGFGDNGSTTMWSLVKNGASGGKLTLFNGSGSPQLYLYGTGGITGNGNASFAGYYTGGTAGVTCSGTPTSSFASAYGIVTHC